MIKKLLLKLHEPLWLALLLMAASLFTLTFVYISQYVFHYDPCILCLYQRKPFFAVVLLSLAAALSAHHRPRAARVYLHLCTLAFVVGAGIAFYHTGVERSWWEGTAACSDAALPMNASVEELREYLQNKRITRCDVPSWQVFGFSMTNYNLLWSMALAAVAFYLNRNKH